MLKENVFYNLELIQDILTEDKSNSIKMVLDNGKYIAIQKQAFADLVEKYQDENNYDNKEPLRMVRISCKVVDDKLQVEKQFMKKSDYKKVYGGRKYVKR